MSHQPLQQSRGRTVTVATNSFAITRLPVKEYILYDVFNPEVWIPRKRQQIIHKLQTDVAPGTFTPRAVYDGSALLYSSRPLRLAAGEGGTFAVSLGATPPPPGSSRGIFQVRLTRSAGSTIKPTDVNFLINGRQTTPQTTTATNLLQLLIRQAPNLDHPNNGRAYFTDADSKPIGGGLELWRGFFQSVRPTLGRMLVNVDISMSTVYQSGPLVDVCLAVLGSKNVRALTMDQQAVDFSILDRHLKKLLVNVKTSGKRTKTIRRLVPNAGSYVFPKDGYNTTIAEHFRDAHNERLKYPDILGVCLSGPKAPFPVIVPIELCTIIPGQLYKKKIPEHLTAEAVKFATIKPKDRLGKIQNGLAGRGGRMESPVLGYRNSEFVTESGMIVEPNPITVDGHVLETPKMKFGRDVILQPRGGSWNVLNQQLNTAKSLTTWAVVNFVERFNSQIGPHFINTLIECCRNLGMNVAPPAAVEIGIGHAVEKAMNAATGNAMANLKTKNRPSMILVLLPQSAAEIRARVKFWGDVTTGIPTQCVREGKIPNANSQYCNNVALKLNARLGGNNSIAQSPVMEKLCKTRYMIMGADVGHPGPGVRNRPSVTSLVWSHDQFATNYVAYSRVQHPRTEIIDGLKEMVMDAIDSFGQRNNFGPERIIFFRDGVSEGEFDQVAKKEIAVIQSGFDDLWIKRGIRAPKPKLTFIVVGKRHHVLFFPLDERDGDRTGNCHAGFVADKGLSSPIAVDFYLQSHAAIQGTSRPSHYIVLADENFQNNLAELQELAFSLCHVYAKATRSVSIPAPVYYADLVCSRATFYFDDALRFADDTSSTSGTDVFDLNVWKTGYKVINPAIDKTMFFL